MNEQTTEKRGTSDNLNSLVGFRNWWWYIGSGIGPKENHDMEEHANRISEIAWNAAKSENAELLEQLKDYITSDEPNSDGCEYSLVMNRVIQKAEELFKPNDLNQGRETKTKERL